jgi:hypothetical protein
MKETHEYDDIIHLSRPEPKKHPPMPPLDRAAQFSPFAALVGHDDAIHETARLTERQIELDEDEKRRIAEKLQLLADRMDEHPAVTLTCFRPDARKSGGTYLTLRGRLKRIDPIAAVLELTDGQSIRMEHLLAVDSPLLGDET